MVKFLVLKEYMAQREIQIKNYIMCIIKIMISIDGMIGIYKSQGIILGISHELCL
jgi:hypothetical protein